MDNKKKNYMEKNIIEKRYYIERRQYRKYIIWGKDYIKKISI